MKGENKNMHFRDGARRRIILSNVMVGVVVVI